MGVVAAGPGRAATVLELLRPITWFAPIWAFGCGVVSVGQPVGARWPLVVAGVALLGPLVFAAAMVGLVLAWAYSAPPARLKRNGWWGNLACAACYEGLPWFTAAAIVAGGGLPDWRVLVVAAVYSAGAHGIMTLNDFKSGEGDRQMGIGRWGSAACRCCWGCLGRRGWLASRWRCRRFWSMRC